MRLSCPETSPSARWSDIPGDGLPPTSVTPEGNALIIIAELKGLTGLDMSLKHDELSEHLFFYRSPETFLVEVSRKWYFMLLGVTDEPTALLFFLTLKK